MTTELTYRITKQILLKVYVTWCPCCILILKYVLYEDVILKYTDIVFNNIEYGNITRLLVLKPKAFEKDHLSLNTVDWCYRITEK